jgi:hypothetical protein
VVGTTSSAVFVVAVAAEVLDDVGLFVLSLAGPDGAAGGVTTPVADAADKAATHRRCIDSGNGDDDATCAAQVVAADKAQDEVEDAVVVMVWRSTDDRCARRDPCVVAAAAAAAAIDMPRPNCMGFHPARLFIEIRTYI